MAPNCRASRRSLPAGGDCAERVAAETRAEAPPMRAVRARSRRLKKEEPGSDMTHQLIRQAATDKVDDFEFVVLCYLRGRPRGTGDDGTVVLDGDAILFEAQRGEEILDGCGNRQIEGARLAVDDEVHLLQGTRCSGPLSCGGVRHGLRNRLKLSMRLQIATG